MNSKHESLTERRCKPCEGGVPALSRDTASALLTELPGWSLGDDMVLEKTLHFRNHYEVIAFVNAVAWISHREDHHPELLVGYNDCRIRYWTHAIHGLSENDFICAAKVDRLLAL